MSIPLLLRLPLVTFSVLSCVAFVACSEDETTPTPVPVEAGADTSATAIVCGQAGSLCAGNEWCEYDPVGSCGSGGERGKCSGRPKVDECSGTCPAVCGCDGKIYCNACEAHASGTDVDKKRDCLPTTGELLAFSLPGDPAKLAIFKKDEARKLCLRIKLVRRLNPQFGLDVPSEWGVDSAEITQDPQDCTITSTGTPPTPSGIAVAPVSGQGRVTFSEGFGKGGVLPCKLSIAARLAFEPTSEYPWVPGVEPIAGDGITVGGACQ